MNMEFFPKLHDTRMLWPCGERNNSFNPGLYRNYHKDTLLPDAILTKCVTTVTREIVTIIPTPP